MAKSFGEIVGVALVRVVAAVGIIGASLFVTFITALFNAWVFQYMWQWYVTPIFGIAAPKLYLLYGLVLTSAFFRNSSSNEKSTSFGEAVGNSIAKGVAILAIGWVVQFVFA